MGLSRELTALGDATGFTPLCVEPLAEAARVLWGEPFPETCDIHQSARGRTLVSIARAARR